MIAIENARLFNETAQALERQTATADILKVIASSPSDVQPVFEAIATSANRLIGGFSTVVLRFVGDSLHLAAFTPTNPEADEFLQASFPQPIGTFPPFLMVRDGATVQFTDTESEGVPPLNRDLARLRGYRSMLFVPLMSGGAPIGMISVTRKEPGSFAEHHMQLLQTFADQAVIAIGNVRLFEQVQTKTHDLSEALQQQTATADVLKVISRSAFDLQTVLETLARSAVELSNARRGVIFLRDGDEFRFRAASYADLHPDWIRFLQEHPQKAGQHSAIARSIATGQTVCVPDVLADPEIEMPATALAGIRAVLAVPLLRDGKVEGIMALSRLTPGSFSARQIDLVQTFADQAVIALENVRLFEQVQARTRELSQSLDDLRTAQDRLVQTEKLASLGQLTAGIAHEIKNPLNFVNNFSALSAELTDELNDVLKSAPLADEVREEVDELTDLLKNNLEKVVQHGKRADSIVKNMLLHSREGAGEHRPADINALVDESLNLAYHGARAEKPQFNVTLQRHFDPDAGMIEVFPQEITRVFLNLIANGFYAVTKRKNENGAGFEPIVSATTKGSGAEVEIRIRDNGTGIPPEVKEKMFNPFFTTKPAGEGTGLGLSMSRDIIVKQHGGRIDVDTEPGAFTEFRIVLPRTRNFSNK
ncbi:MAG: GAF domain-containing protein [Bradyrhizobium sp.]